MLLICSFEVGENDIFVEATGHLLAANGGPPASTRCSRYLVAILPGALPGDAAALRITSATSLGFESIAT
jgi:hypothetical protein